MTRHHLPEQCAARWILTARRCCEACTHRPADDTQGDGGPGTA